MDTVGTYVACMLCGYDGGAGQEETGKGEEVVLEIAKWGNFE